MVGTNKTGVRTSAPPPKGIFVIPFFYLTDMKPTIAVVYKTIYRKKEKIHLEVFNDVYVDDIIDGNKRKPLIPHDAEIIEIGVGKGFEKKYREKYKIEETKIGENTNDKLLKELQMVVNKQRGQ